jgi:hypothetical protein
MSVIPGFEANLSHISVLASLFGKFQTELANAVAAELVEDDQIAASAQQRSKKRAGAALHIGGVVVDQDSRHWVGFPRNRPFYEAVIVKFGLLSRECAGTTIGLVLEWLPDHSKDHCTLDRRDQAYGTKEEYTYGAWLNTVSGFDTKNHRHVDIVVCTVCSPIDTRNHTTSTTPAITLV